MDVKAINGEFNMASVATWNLVNIARRVISSPENAVNFSIQNGLLPRSKQCPFCHNSLKLTRSRAGSMSMRFYCPLRSCSGYKKTYSFTRGTWFERVKLNWEQVIIFTYCFSEGITEYEKIRNECNLNGMQSLSNDTISSWLNFCRETCLEYFIRQKGPLIGGHGREVQIDESLFGKRKYHRGRRVDHNWILGGICTETDEIFLSFIPDNKKTSDQLIPMIENNVRPGTTIVTDEWRSYRRLTSLGWTHYRVNHSKFFVHPRTRRHTQRIESLWSAVKRSFNSRGPKHKNLMLKFGEYLWRRSLRRAGRKPNFLAFLQAIRTVYPPHQF